MRLTGRPTLTLLLAALLTGGLVTALATSVSAQRPPAARALHLDPDVMALACAPSLVYERPLESLQVTGGQDSFRRYAFAPNDLITINAGTDNGIDVGQEYYVRRLLREGRNEPSRKKPAVLRTTGWIRIYAVDPKMSLATITHACETVDVGDYLEPFALPEVPAAQATGHIKPQKENYARIMLGADRRQVFAGGDFFIVNQGSDHGITPGARFVIYRDKLQAKNFLFELGEAVAMDVRAESATLQVTFARDAMRAGDYVAIRKEADSRQPAAGSGQQR